MKAVVIGIVLLFLSIFGVKKFVEIQEENATLAAEKEYKAFKKEREAAGDTLSLTSFMESLEQTTKALAIEQPGVAEYVSETGYVFDCSRLEHPKRLGETKTRKKFKSRVGQFGPVDLRDWKALLNPAIATNPTDRMVAAKVLRNFDEWRKPMEGVIKGLLKGTKDGGLIGLHRLRKLDPAKKALVLQKIVEFQRARITIGRLQFFKGSTSHPYDTAEDLILVADLFAREAIEKDEFEVSEKLDELAMDYIDFLASHKAGSRRVKKLQETLLATDLNQAVFNALQAKRIAGTPVLEKQYTSLTKRERDSLSIFESGYVLTKKEKWQLLVIFQKAGMMLSYTDDGDTKRKRFTKSMLTEFGEYVNSTRDSMVLNKDALRVYTKSMRELENVVYVVLKKLVRRQEAAVKLGISNYYIRMKEFPEELSQLTDKDIPYIPNNPLSGKAYTYKFDNSYNDKMESLDRFIPNVVFSLGNRSVVKK